MHIKLLLSATALSLTACWVPSETGRQMQADILLLKNQYGDARKDLDAVKAAESEHNRQNLQKLEEITSALQEFNQSTRSTDADFGTQMERMIQELQELRGAVEVNEHRIGETETKLTETLNSRIEALKGTAADPNNAPTNESISAASKTGAPKDKKELLAYGYKLQKQGKIADARGIYHDVIRQWPKDNGITDQAIYEIGETYFEEKKYDVALREYIKIVDKFSTGTLVDDAYYKIGVCSVELGNYDDAQTFFSELVTNYKKSPLFKQAKTRLDEVTKHLEQEKAKKRGRKR